MNSPTTLTTSTSAGRLKKVYKGLDLALFSVCALLVIDQLAASASIGADERFVASLSASF